MTAFAKTYLTNKERIPAALLISSYLFGMVVIAHGLISGFVYLTSLHLLLCTVLILITHRPMPSPRIWIWLVVCYALGWTAEYVGVHYKWLFGEYIYGDVLGPKVYAIPLIIGVNWILVIYGVCTTLNMLFPTLNRVFKAIFAAFLLVALDYLIEPVAIKLDFWTWMLGTPPTQNFIGWLGVGLIQTSLFYLIVPFTENRLAPVLVLLQVIFFSYLSIFG
ncbi:MAG: carotenoid biosynthesis protein [Saprospiraceae bacterium]